MHARSSFAAVPLFALAVAFALPVFADDAGELTAAEKTALKKVERELLDLAKFAAKGNDAAAAVEALRLALEVVPDADKPQQELEKLQKKPPRGEPKAGFAEKLAAQRTEAHREVALALVDAAQATEEAHPDRYQRYLGLIQTRFPVQEALTRLNLAYFAPYLRWTSATEVALLERGGEVHEGQHLEPDAVSALDRRHSSWSDPWVVADDIHEVRTTLPLRTANQILHFVAAYRRHFLERFGPLWDLQPPSGKLPLIVTRTQADLRQQLSAVAGGAAAAGGVQGAAFYLQSTGKLNPCFVTYEPCDVTGVTFKIERFEQLVIPLIHEVTHQLAFEYSKHDYVATRQIQHHFWSVEAIANFMGYHVLDDGAWRLTHPRTIPMGQGMIEGPFAWCVNNKGSLQPLRRFMALSPQEFMTVENYHMAATLAYFLLEGEGGKYRANFVKMLEKIHEVRDQPGTFDDCFPGVNHDAMQREWLDFVGAIKLD
jgi:hypothetical protein